MKLILVNELFKEQTDTKNGKKQGETLKYCLARLRQQDLYEVDNMNFVNFQLTKHV